MYINTNLLFFIREKLKNKKNYYNFFSKNFDKKKSINLSYDYQSGSYIKRWSKMKKFDFKHDHEVAEIINKNFPNLKSILDCGCGELTRTQNIFRLLRKKINYYAFDLSLNRILIGLKKFNLKNKISAFVADMENLPLLDRSFDVCFTIHSIEPNRGKERELLKEIIRVSNLGAVLVEPDFLIASNKQKKRMKKLNYCTNLEKNLKELNYTYKKIPLKNVINLNNRSSAFVILKKSGKKNKFFFVDPCFKKKLKKKNNFFYSFSSDVIYPIISKIPILDVSKSLFLPKKKINGRLII